MISAVIFDLDETLLDRTGSLKAFLADQYERYASYLGSVSFEIWRDHFLRLDARGYVRKSIVYPSILAEFGGDMKAAEVLFFDYQARCAVFAKPFDGMMDTLATIRSLGRAIGIVTNGETQFQSRHISALGLDHMVDAVLISEAEGLRKPDATLFLRAAMRLGVKPEQCLFVGDNPTADVLGANAVGMKTAWFRLGREWPSDLPDLPDDAIDSLPQVLNLLLSPF